MPSFQNRGWLIALALAGLLLLLPRPISETPGAVVERIARAIARAEGFYVAGSLPQRRNNPGSIVANGTLIQYASAADGWAALYRQIERMLTGNSLYYSPDMSIEQIAVIYTGGDNPSGWARIVAGALGVPTSTPIGEVAA